VRELDKALADTHRVLLDTSALIAYHSSAEPVHHLARHLLRRVEDDADPLTAYFSVVSAAELLIRPYRRGRAELTLMHTFLARFPHLVVLEMDLTVAAQAATVRAVTGIRLPDAIIVASGLLAGCEAIVSNDERWKKRMEDLFKEFTWVCLGDYA
jgi:predicted nucleic acid-binding protein